ncbi:MAG: sodium:proton antiporter [Bacteroidales bacterium]|nr:sodium:proton antiporter [Bacteroidales bacterium]
MNQKGRLLIAAIPLAVLTGLLALDIFIFGADSIMGASQVTLLLAAGICVWLSMRVYKLPWENFETAIRTGLGDVAPAIMILLLIGAISGTWTLSGVVPSFIYYGLKIISPKIFLLTACVLCAVVSLVTGSSWTTIATVGVALLGIGKAEGFSEALTAGAIISGAYFGDKISPLSDTTVLASSISQVDLFTHIRYMLFTTVPSFVITLIIFTLIGLSHSGGDTGQMDVYASVLQTKFNITPWLMLVPAITAVLIWKRFPAMTVLALSVLCAAAASLIFQPEIIASAGESVTSGSHAKIMFAGVVESIYNSVSPESGNADVDALIATRGMLGMLNTVFLILCATCFGACMRESGMIADLAGVMTRFTRSRGGLVGSTVCTGTVLNGIVSDQYLSIILTSHIFRESYAREGYEDRLLSRSVEDSATVTSPLFPWSSCGMTQATILSVPTMAYAPFCFFNLLSPLISIAVGIAGWKIARRSGGASKGV